MTASPPQRFLRSPREKLDGYIILPRLIDKVRAHAQGMLPAAYHRNLLRPGITLDGRLLTFIGVEGEALREMVVTSDGQVVVRLDGYHSIPVPMPIPEEVAGPLTQTYAD